MPKKRDQYPSISAIPANVPVEIYRDGELVTTVEDTNAAFKWLLGHTHGSVSYALCHGGYWCKAAPAAEA
jgi:hypothetical protein